jgi:hypothetical protein
VHWTHAIELVRCIGVQEAQQRHSSVCCRQPNCCSCDLPTRSHVQQRLSFTPTHQRVVAVAGQPNIPPSRNALATSTCIYTTRWICQHAARQNRWPPRREETSSRFSCTRWHVQPVTHTHSHQPTCCLLAVHNHLTLWVVYSKRDELASSALDVPRVGDVEEHRVATLSMLWQAPPSHHVDLLLSPSPHTHVRVRIDTFSSLTHPNRKSASAHIGVRSTGQKHQRYGVLMLVVATPHCRHPHTC